MTLTNWQHSDGWYEIPADKRTNSDMYAQTGQPYWAGQVYAGQAQDTYQHDQHAFETWMSVNMVYPSTKWKLRFNSGNSFYNVLFHNKNDAGRFAQKFNVPLYA